MARWENMRLFSLIICFILLACAHDKAWVAESKGNGGRIGYYQSVLFDERDDVVRDFNKAAKKICGNNDWIITREIIPPPTDAISGVRNAASGDVHGAASSARAVTIHEVIHRSTRMNKDIKVEYGNPLKTWNEAQIQCKK